MSDRGNYAKLKDIYTRAEKVAKKHLAVDTYDAMEAQENRSLNDYCRNNPRIPSKFREELRVYGDHLHVIDLDVRKAIEAGTVARYLDIGGGSGRAAIELYDELYGMHGDLLNNHLEITVTSMADYREKYGNTEDLERRNINYVSGEAANIQNLADLSLKHGPFDVITAVHVLLHVRPDQMIEHSLRKIYRALKKDGIAVLNGVDIIGSASNHIEVERTEYREKAIPIRRYLQRQLEEAGLQIQLQLGYKDGKVLTKIVMLRNDKKFDAKVLGIPYDAHGNQMSLEQWYDSLPEAAKKI